MSVNTTVLSKQGNTRFDDQRNVFVNDNVKGESTVALIPTASQDVADMRRSGIADDVRPDEMVTAGLDTYSAQTSGKPYESQGRFITLARWEGVVTELFDSYFEAQVIDLVSEESATVQFDFADIADSDVPLCVPGALFYWSIGYDVRPGGQRLRGSVVMFRRIARKR